MTLWYVARGAGLAALVLLTISTALGAVMSARGRAGARVGAQYVHRATAATGLAALALHVGTILADSYAGVGWRGALVPLLSGYRPVWVALGTIAVYTFVLTAAAGLARARFARSARGARVWRGVHALAYAAWALAVLHGLNAGTDSSVGWVRLVYVGCVAAVAGAVVVRVAAPRLRTRGVLVAGGAR